MRQDAEHEELTVDYGAIVEDADSRLSCEEYAVDQAAVFIDVFYGVHDLAGSRVEVGQVVRYHHRAKWGFMPRSDEGYESVASEATDPVSAVVAWARKRSGKPRRWVARPIGNPGMVMS